MERKKAILLILDGWGIGNKSQSDVIHNGDTPYWNGLIKKYPNSKILTSGKDVGLPDGQMGNSEVGHLNIGAGRILYQDLVRINKEIEDNSISQNAKVVEAFSYAKKENKSVHFLGLVSNGGVHSSEKHLYKLCDIAKEYGLEKVFIHAFTDGRDTDPKSGINFIKELQEHLKNSAGEIASIVGRYYAMDRDNRWDRIKLGYDLLVKAKGEKFVDPINAVAHSYKNDITDEFIKPVTIIDETGEQKGTINEGDVVICFNFRTDRLRQMTTALSQKDMPEYNMKALSLKYYTMTKYNNSFKNVNVIYDKDNVNNTIGEIVSKFGKKQIRIAETEKYAHVTFFFSGGREKEFEGETRILIPSPKVATYDLKPEMGAYQIAESIANEMKKQETDFICLNFANGDMVGHTGIYKAILKAVNVVDNCLRTVVETAKENGYEAIIIADHGNADYSVNADGSPNTAHSTNPVPCIVVSDKYKNVNNGILADIAPTLLYMLGIDTPKEMTGKSLVNS